jgi:hypothetical protein
VDFTDADAKVAGQATGLLADQGHPDVSVTPEQVVRWRKADAIPVDPGSRGGGRGRAVRYLPEAPPAAAALASVLAEDRNLDVAILAAFGRRAPVAEAGVRIAADHYLRAVENRAAQAWRHRFEPRSAVPWRQRLPMQGSRQSGASLVSDGALAILLGRQPRAGADSIALVAEGLLGVNGAHAVAQSRAVRLVLKRVSLAALRRGARYVDFGRWQSGAVFADNLLRWLHLVGELESLTGATAPAQPGHIGRALVTLIDARRQMACRSNPTGLDVAVIGLGVGLVTVGSTKRTRAVSELATLLGVEVRRFSAVVAATKALPERWRPAYGFASGITWLAELPKVEREELMAHMRAWLADHSEEAAALLADSTPLAALAGSAPSPADAS